MIERHHYFRLRAESRGQRDHIAAACRDTLPSLPGVRACVVGTPADGDSEAAWDLAVTLRFATLPDLEAYRADPAHRSFVEQILTPHVEVKKIWNFDIG